MLSEIDYMAEMNSITVYYGGRGSVKNDLDCTERAPSQTRLVKLVLALYIVAFGQDWLATVKKEAVEDVTGRVSSSKFLGEQ